MAFETAEALKQYDTKICIPITPVMFTVDESVPRYHIGLQQNVYD